MNVEQYILFLLIIPRYKRKFAAPSIKLNDSQNVDRSIGSQSNVVVFAEKKMIDTDFKILYIFKITQLRSF